MKIHDLENMIKFANDKNLMSKPITEVYELWIEHTKTAVSA